MRGYNRLEQRISPTRIGINIVTNKLHQGKFHKFKIQHNIKITLRSLILINLINSLIINTRKAFLQIHTGKL
jgi:hypothetical protein